jgi:hypothetical protein
MDDVLKNLTACLRGQEEAMRDALKRLVLIQSGTCNKAGVDDRVCRAVCELLEPLPLERRSDNGRFWKSPFTIQPVTHTCQATGLIRLKKRDAPHDVESVTSCIMIITSGFDFRTECVQ